MTAFADRISQVELNLQAENDFIFRVRGVAQEFTDIEFHRDRWNNERVVSALINPKVDSVEIRHNCGCCNDSPLEVWPFKEVNGVKVFSNPPVFTVGEKYLMGTGDSPYDGWERALREATIPETIVDKVGAYFKENPPEEINDD